MFKTILFTGLIVSFCLGLLWFFSGRIILKPILATTEAVRAEVESAQSFGRNVAEGHNGMEFTVTAITGRSETLESGLGNVVDRNEGLISRSNVIENGLENLSGSIRAGEKRYGLIVGVVGELRDTTETFGEAIENANLEN